MILSETQTHYQDIVDLVISSFPLFEMVIQYLLLNLHWLITMPQQKFLELFIHEFFALASPKLISIPVRKKI